MVTKDMISFAVVVPRVPGVSTARWQAYILEAVQCWAGQFEPVDGGYPDSAPESGDPLGPPMKWSEKVTVRRLRHVTE